MVNQRSIFYDYQNAIITFENTMVLLAVIVRALMEDSVFPTLENLFVHVNQGSGESIASREIMDNLETQDVSENLAPLILSNHEALVNLEHH